MSTNLAIIVKNVRPLAVICALHYLVRNSELYISAGIHVDENWVNDIFQDNYTAEHNEDERETENNEDSDHFSDIDETENRVGNTDTLLVEIPDEADIGQETEYIFAPGILNFGV